MTSPQSQSPCHACLARTYIDANGLCLACNETFNDILNGRWYPDNLTRYYPVVLLSQRTAHAFPDSAKSNIVRVMLGILVYIKGALPTTPPLYTCTEVYRQTHRAAEEAFASTAAYLHVDRTTMNVCYEKFFNALRHVRALHIFEQNAQKELTRYFERVVKSVAFDENEAGVARDAQPDLHVFTRREEPPPSYEYTASTPTSSSAALLPVPVNYTQIHTTQYERSVKKRKPDSA